jgi:hypothetical protein
VRRDILITLYKAGLGCFDLHKILSNKSEDSFDRIQFFESGRRRTVEEHRNKWQDSDIIWRKRVFWPNRDI